MSKIALGCGIFEGTWVYHYGGKGHFLSPGFRPRLVKPEGCEDSIIVISFLFFLETLTHWQQRQRFLCSNSYSTASVTNPPKMSLREILSSSSHLRSKHISEPQQLRKSGEDSKAELGVFWVCFLLLSLPNYTASSKLFNLSGLSFPVCKRGCYMTSKLLSLSDFLGVAPPFNFSDWGSGVPQ